MQQYFALKLLKSSGSLRVSKRVHSFLGDNRASRFLTRSKVNVKTQIEHNCLLDVEMEPKYSQRTGIVCTIGPACANLETLVTMIENGMKIARLNFSHGSHEFHANNIHLIREANNKVKFPYRPVAIAIDTKGPEIRTGIFENDPSNEVHLENGEYLTITTNPTHREEQTKELLWVDYANLPKVLKPGKFIYLDDGLISLRVTEVRSETLKCQVVNDGILGSRKGINLPGTPVDIPSVTPQDRKDLNFAVENDIDIVFASFIRDAAAVRKIREILGQNGRNIRVISKVENIQGINNFDEIIDESDGVMVARGDLGIEIPVEKVFLAQKKMIAKCNIARKPVICATQMLESMTHKSRPTRAEASDVANAVLDGTDCVMLSGETAKGDFPVECVRITSLITREAEVSIFHSKFFEELRDAALSRDMDHVLAASLSAVGAAYNVDAQAIIVLTKTGMTAAYVAQFRPKCPIIAVTRDPKVARQLQLQRGVIPSYFHTPKFDNVDWTQDVEMRVQFACKLGKAYGFIQKGGHIVVHMGWKEGAGYTNTVRIDEVAF